MIEEFPTSEEEVLDVAAVINEAFEKQLPVDLEVEGFGPKSARAADCLIVAEGPDVIVITYLAEDGTQSEPIPIDRNHIRKITVKGPKGPLEPYPPGSGLELVNEN